MMKIASLVGRELKWSQPKARKKEFELHAGDELAATLRFESILGSLATAESGDGCWTFKRVGFFRTHLSIRHCDDDTHDIAVFRNKTWESGGTLEMAGGSTFLASTNFWDTKLTFSTESKEPLVVFKTDGMIHLSAEVEIMPKAATLPELPLMMILGWYLAIAMMNDAMGGAAAAAAGAA